MISLSPLFLSRSLVIARFLLKEVVKAYSAFDAHTTVERGTNQAREDNHKQRQLINLYTFVRSTRPWMNQLARARAEI